MILDKTEFIKELEQVINKHSRENISNTPDFILAEFMKRCLEAGEYLIKRREQWYGRENHPPTTLPSQPNEMEEIRKHQAISEILEIFKI